MWWREGVREGVQQGQLVTYPQHLLRGGGIFFQGLEQLESALGWLFLGDALCQSLDVRFQLALVHDGGGGGGMRQRREREGVGWVKKQTGCNFALSQSPFHVPHSIPLIFRCTNRGTCTYIYVHVCTCTSTLPDLLGGLAHEGPRRHPKFIRPNAVCDVNLKPHSYIVPCTFIHLVRAIVFKTSDY